MTEDKKMAGSKDTADKNGIPLLSCHLQIPADVLGL
jgi:hypothetical protein